MKRFLLKMALAFLCLLAVVVGLLLLLPNDVVTSKYNSYSEALADNLFGRGWLPDIIPASSSNIVTVNNLDINTSNGEFSYSASDANAFFEKLKKYEGRKARYENYEAIVEEMKSRSYDPFEYSRPNEGTVWLFFVNKKLSHVYYYIW